MASAAADDPPQAPAERNPRGLKDFLEVADDRGAKNEHRQDINGGADQDGREKA